MKTVCIVQARMTSKRLPGKVMLPLRGKPVIWHVLTRCKTIPGIDEVICAVPDDPASEPIEQEAARIGVRVVRGSEGDVLSRYHAAATDADTIMRITADNPFIDPTICARVLALLPGHDYASNVMPRRYRRGLDCEVFTKAALDRAHAQAVTEYDREHVTPFMQRRMDCVNLPGPGDDGLNLTLDTKEDYEALKELHGHELWSGRFGTDYTHRNRVDWQARIPFWRDILRQTNALSVLEVGCNAGWNLRALREINGGLDLHGIDINRSAVAEAVNAGLSVTEGTADDLSFGEKFDLVATVGCLIHISPESLEKTMLGICDASRAYVLAVEYAADQEEEIEYRGQMGALWKRPFGRLYEEIGMSLIEEGDAGPGFDDCHYWLLLKWS